nr:SAM-dependent chlorinase/fluorinase [Leptolyngbya sp. BC1307]
MITLLSDFGLRDAYVAVMKGVIASICPAAVTCDLTHEILPQDILAARFNLMVAYPHFPEGTVHLAVVDPGVGSARRAIALRCAHGFLVGPDNGLFSGVLQSSSVLTAVALTNAEYWRVREPSHTFHGRDIFAPAAAHLAGGVPIEALGDRFDPATLVQPALPTFAQRSERSGQAVRCTGSVQYIDGFGNLISNIPGQAVPDQPWQIVLETPAGRLRHFSGIKTYSEVPTGTLSALVGSHGWVEVACSGGNAAQALEIAIGAEVILESRYSRRQRHSSKGEAAPTYDG